MGQSAFGARGFFCGEWVRAARRARERMGVGAGLRARELFGRPVGRKRMDHAEQVHAARHTRRLLGKLAEVPPLGEPRLARLTQSVFPARQQGSPCRRLPCRAGTHRTSAALSAADAACGSGSAGLCPDHQSLGYSGDGAHHRHRRRGASVRAGHGALAGAGGATPERARPGVGQCVEGAEAGGLATVGGTGVWSCRRGSTSSLRRTRGRRVGI